ncbi:hypothetical protein RJ639_008975 [Escallonia herrerae]|uniref:Uncharacterized protein n=1 Tax=Escallonia herrerae TaxID=1293975 RepID=A0AA88VTK0_9ASTE|nr:hypothetical protein RJ639_008975 [Escallonia herrerae]
MQSRPKKINKDLWCHYHNDHGHTTNNCGSLKRAIEALIKWGKLRKFIAHKDRRQKSPPEVEEREDRAEHAGTINTISGGLAVGGSSGKSRKSYVREVCRTSQNLSKKQKTTPVPTISFFDEDLKDVKMPHDDPLVIIIKARNFEVKRVLVDNGSSAEILFYDAFRKMNILTDRLQKMDSPLYGFSNHSVAVEGIIALSVTIGTPPTQANLMLDFMVVKVPSAYNAILGRPTLNQLQAVVSTYHLKMKFPMKNEIGEMQRGEPDENLVSIEVYPGDEDKTVWIGSNLKEDTKLELVNLLRTYADVVAWTATDMPGVDREYALRFGFQASNNEAEYEALLVGIRLALALRVDSLLVHSDSQLVVNHFLGDYEARDERMAQYLELVKTSAVKFNNFAIHQIPRDQNTQADALSRLSFAEATDVRRSIYLEFLKDRSISSQTEIGVIDQEPCWMDTIIKFFSTGELPNERHEARNLHVRAARIAYTDHPIDFGRFSNPFAMWGVDLLRPFPMASGQRRFVIVAIDYFTKWTEAESLATITSAKCEDFFWKNVVCHFGVPRALVVDNGKQFDNNNFQTFCTNLSIDLRFTSAAHPQSNGQTENMNRSILQGLKKKLDDAKGAWVDELPKVLWAYRTTPHSVTGETPFFLCYGTEALLPVKIGVPTIWALHFNEVNNEDGLRGDRGPDLIKTPVF